MKTLATLVTLALLANSSMVAAKPSMPQIQKDRRVLTFNLLTEGSNVSSGHAPNFHGGTAEINYLSNTVTLKMETVPKCPAGLSCAAVLETKEFQLPIIRIYSDNECFTTVIAQRDLRPVDGALAQIKINDFSNSNCRFFVKPISDIEYLTSYFNRKTGKQIKVVSTLKADLVSVTSAPALE